MSNEVKVFEKNPILEKQVLDNIRTEIGLTYSGKFIGDVELRESHVGAIVYLLPKTNHRMNKGKIVSWNVFGVMVEFVWGTCKVNYSNLTF